MITQAVNGQSYQVLRERKRENEHFKIKLEMGQLIFCTTALGRITISLETYRRVTINSMTSVLSRTTLSVMTFRIMSLSRMTLNIMTLIWRQSFY